MAAGRDQVNPQAGRDCVADVYAQALPLATRAEVTEIDADFAGDAYAPALGPGWTEVARARHVSATGLPYSFVSHTNTQQGN